MTYKDANSPLLMPSGQVTGHLEISPVKCAHVLVHYFVINKNIHIIRFYRTYCHPEERCSYCNAMDFSA